MSASDTLVKDNTPRNQYTASSNQKKFDYTFLVFDSSHITVKETVNPGTSSESTSTLTEGGGQDYTVSGVGNEDGGTVELNSGADDGDRYTIYRSQPVDRLTDFLQTGDYKSEDINLALDTLFLILQERELEIDRAATLPQESDLESLELPLPSAGALIGWNSSGDALVNAQRAVYTEDVSFGGGGGTKTITHDLNQKEVIVQFYDDNDELVRLNKVKHVDKNNIDIESSTSLTGTVLVSI